jgi:HNH endonuclease
MGARHSSVQANVRLVKIAPGEKACFWDECRAGNYVCVGWDEVGNLKTFDSKDDFQTAFKRRCSYSPSWKANELWTLMELRPGDKVIANNGLSKVVGVGTVKKPGYVWMPARKRESYRHTVSVHWDKTNWGKADYKEIPPQPWNNTVAQVSRKLFESVSSHAIRGESVITEKATKEQRKFLARLVRQRQGQPRFRKALLRAYDNRCAISNCDVEAALEAAHIDPKKTAVPCNGILLRADLHLLFDLRLLAIDPVTLRVHVKPTLKGSEYWTFRNRKIRVPGRSDWKPHRQLLGDRYRLFISG